MPEETLHFLSPDEINLIKLKFSKNHRSQKDYMKIESLLMEKDLYVIECLTSHPEIKSCACLMCVGGMLLAFTNKEDCIRQMDTFANNLGMDIEYNMKAMAFLGTCSLADQNGVKLAVDLDSSGRNPFLLYGNGHYNVAWMGKA
ncbi:MAG: hypothetical protein IJ899_20660 [Blautia sp.]|nr:hypothetical protein [Blautia sp.]